MKKVYVYASPTINTTGIEKIDAKFRKKKKKLN